jgi:hypothetical protein
LTKAEWFDNLEMSKGQKMTKRIIRGTIFFPVIFVAYVAINLVLMALGAEPGTTGVWDNLLVMYFSWIVFMAFQPQFKKAIAWATAE